MRRFLLLPTTSDGNAEGTEVLVGAPVGSKVTDPKLRRCAFDSIVAFAAFLLDRWIYLSVRKCEHCKRSDLPTDQSLVVSVKYLALLDAIINERSDII